VCSIQFLSVCYYLSLMSHSKVKINTSGDTAVLVSDHCEEMYKTNSYLSGKYCKFIVILNYSVKQSPC
jgi:hypothetical protein